MTKKMDLGDSYFSYDYFHQNFSSLEDFELLKIIKLRCNYQSVAVEAAKDIALKRGLIDKEFNLVITDQDILIKLNSIENTDQIENQDRGTKKPFTFLLVSSLFLIAVGLTINTLINWKPLEIIKNAVVLSDPIEIFESSETNSYYTCKIYFEGIEELYKIDPTCYKFLNTKKLYTDIKRGRIVDLYVKNGVINKLIFNGHDYCEFDESRKKYKSNITPILIIFYILGGLLIFGTLYENVKPLKTLVLKFKK